MRMVNSGLKVLKTSLEVEVLETNVPSSLGNEGLYLCVTYIHHLATSINAFGPTAGLDTQCGRLPGASVISIILLVITGSGI